MPEPKENHLGTIVVETKQRGRIPKSYHSYTILPYLHEDTSPKDILNIFPGFEMQRFRNKMDVKQTKIWKWLWVCWANRTAYKMKYLLTAIAMK